MKNKQIEELYQTGEALFEAVGEDRAGQCEGQWCIDCPYYDACRDYPFEWKKMCKALDVYASRHPDRIGEAAK